jgi:Ca2+-binding EF-hand superfamily protein
MAPKKEKKEKKGKKGKKGKQEGGASFTDFLDDMFFVSQADRERMRERMKERIAEAFSYFQDRSKDLADIRELGVIIRHLGLNPTVQQLAIIQPMVEDAETGNYIVYSKFEPLMIDLIETKQLKYTEQGADGMPQPMTSLVFRDSEDTIQRSFDTLWEDLGRKVDQDKQRYIDGDQLRELMMKPGNVESFDETEMQDFLAAAQDVGTNYVKEDLYVMLALE